jgi:hypothetical protein
MTNYSNFLSETHRCDSCGGDGNGCCDHSWPTPVTVADTAAILSAGGYKCPVQSTWQNHVYVMPDGSWFDVDPKGWGDKYTPA